MTSQTSTLMHRAGIARSKAGVCPPSCSAPPGCSWTPSPPQALLPARRAVGRPTPPPVAPPQCSGNLFFSESSPCPRPSQYRWPGTSTAPTSFLLVTGCSLAANGRQNTPRDCPKKVVHCCLFSARQEHEAAHRRQKGTQHITYTRTGVLKT